MDIGKIIKEERLLKGLTQKQLGELCVPPIAESTIRRYELNKLNPKYETLVKIAKALHTSITMFLDDELFDAFDSDDDKLEVNLINSKMLTILSDSQLPETEKDKKAKEILLQSKIMGKAHMDNAETARKFLASSLFEMLNHIGKDKAIDHLNLLVKDPKYTDKSKDLF